MSHQPPARDLSRTSSPARRPRVTVRGTMPEWAKYADRRPLLAAADSCLRGIGQVVFMNNPITGLLILLALLVADRHLGVMAAVALLASTLTAHLLHLERARIREGLFGFNGVLVGAAFAVFLAPRWGVAVFAASIVGGAASTIVMVATTAVLRVVGLPPLTVPFNVATITLLWTTFASTRVGRGAALTEHALAHPINPVLRALSTGAGADGGIGAASLLNVLGRGVGQVFLADSTLAGLIMLVGIGVCSPVALFMALAGSAIGGLAGIALGASGHDIYHGLWGFNSVLTAVALCGVFLPPTWKSTAFAGAGAVATAIVYGSLASIFARWGVSCFTLPFCVTTLGFLLVKEASPHFRDPGKFRPAST